MSSFADIVDLKEETKTIAIVLISETDICV